MKIQNQKWVSEYAETLQYLTQIVKCQDLICFPISRSSYLIIFPLRLLSSPIPLSQTDDGLETPERAWVLIVTNFHHYFLSLV